MNHFKYIFIFALSSLLLLQACVDDEFDSPKPIPIPETNTSIEELVKNYQGVQINFDTALVFSGTVISSDEQGNFFETLYLQDGEYAIAIRADVNSLYAEYPPGSLVVVNLQGIFMSDFAGLIQIDGITETNVKQHLFRKSLEASVDTLVVTDLSSLNLDLVPRLVRLEGVEFVDIGATYAEEGGGAGRNRDVKDCNDNTLTVRNSDFADFASTPLPLGNGSITGVFTRFRNFIQLVINSPADVNMNGVRCGAGTGTETLMDIADVRDLYTGSVGSAPDEKKIRGVVISDLENQNITGRNLVIQDQSGGIVVRFDANHPFALNTELEIVISNAELSEFNGLLQLNNVPLARAQILNLNANVEPKVFTIQEIIDNFENLESTLVNVLNPSFSGSNTFSGVTEVNDQTAAISMFTRNQAAFADSPLPEKADAMTAIVSQGGSNQTMQLNMRSLNDLTNPDGGGSGGGNSTIPFSEDFASGIPSNWIVTNTVGSRSWSGRDFDGVYYANMSAFSSGNILDVETWLITPKFDFDAQSDEQLEVIIADAFRNGNPLTLMYSTDYDGSANPSTATWTPIGNDKIDPLINNSGSYDNIYESTGPIDLSGIQGEAHLAFVYSSMGATVSTTVQISDVIINSN